MNKRKFLYIIFAIQIIIFFKSSVSIYVGSQKQTETGIVYAKDQGRSYRGIYYRTEDGDRFHSAVYASDYDRIQIGDTVSYVKSRREEIDREANFIMAIVFNIFSVVFLLHGLVLLIRMKE